MEKRDAMTFRIKTLSIMTWEIMTLVDRERNTECDIKTEQDGKRQRDWHADRVRERETKI